ncbi:MAG: hypothetical protein Kow0099_29370 [Candidatus Abyssubacteria bacterium]
MSIILDALKKIQEQKRAASTDAAQTGTAEESASLSAAKQAAHARRMTPAGEVAVPVSAVTTPIRGARPRTAQATPQRFANAPKLLLGIILILGVFTTGWFLSSIYFNLKSSPTRIGTEAETALVKTNETAVDRGRLDAPESAPVQTSSEPAQPAATTLPGASVAKAVAQEAPQIQEVAAPQAASTAPAETAVPVGATEEDNRAPGFRETPALAPAPERAASSRSAAPMKETQPAAVVLPDPELQAQPGGKGRPELKINAIAWKSKDPKAIVNMQRVYEGDIIEGAKVLVIQRHGIIFEYEGEPFEVRF